MVNRELYNGDKSGKIDAILYSNEHIYDCVKFIQDKPAGPEDKRNQ